MYKLDCFTFSCSLRATCLYDGSCAKCKIHKCNICVLKHVCKEGKENRKNESKV